MGNLRRPDEWVGERVGIAAVLALASSLLWGSSDFLGGTASRRRPAIAVVGASQLIGLVAVAIVAAATGAFGGPLSWLPWSVAAGLVGMGALAAFYTGLASGTMGVVAPVAALGVVVPVVGGLVAGERPQPLQLVGIAVAVVGIVLASGPELSGGASARPLVLALLAAIGFGLALLLLAGGSETSPLLTLLGMRATSGTVIVVLALSIRSTGGLRTVDLPVLVAIGIADAAANWTFGLASTAGLVSVVAVLGSLYPAVTVLLARAFHGERMQPVQNVGVVTALAGVGLITVA